MRSFKVPDAQTATETATAVLEAPATATTAVAAPQTTSQALARPTNGYTEGPVDKSDIKTPFLSCVQAVGPKSVLFTPGTLVLGESAITTAPTPPNNATTRVRVMFLHASKSWVENLPYNPTPGAPRPRVVRSEAELASVSGITQWIGNTPPTYIPKTTCIALVRSPANLDDGQFSILANEHTYAPTMVSFQKTSYQAAKVLWTDLNYSLKGDPTTTFYDLFWVRELKGQNWVWVAKLVRVRDEVPSPELMAIGRKLSGGSASFEGDEVND